MEEKVLNTNSEASASAFDWWQLKLFQFIKDSHPYMLTSENESDTLQFIVDRAEAAKKFYEQRMLSGVAHLFAQEEACEEVLIGDLKYSPTDFIAEVASDSKGVDLTDDQKVDIYFKIKHLFKERAYMYEHPEEEDLISEEIKKLL